MFWISLFIFTVFASALVYDEIRHHRARALDLRERYGLLADGFALFFVALYLWIFRYSDAALWGLLPFLLLAWVSISKEDWLSDRILPHRERWLHGFLYATLVVVFFVQFGMWPFLDGAGIVVGWFLPFSTWGLRWSLGLWMAFLLLFCSYQAMVIFRMRKKKAVSSASPSALQVREARSEEAATLVAFQKAMAFESEHVVLSEEVLRPGVEAVFRDPSLGTYYVATQGESVVGCLLVTREWSEWRNGHILWIQSVYVTPEARGLGVYRALYEHLRTKVRESDNLRGIRLYAEKENLRARRVYARLGMREDRYIVCEWLNENDRKA